MTGDPLLPYEIAKAFGVTPEELGLSPLAHKIGQALGLPELSPLPQVYGTVVEDIDGEVLMLIREEASEGDPPNLRVTEAVILRTMEHPPHLRASGDLVLIPSAQINRNNRYMVVKP